MGIYRGPGGTGDAVNDASSEALITIAARDAALAAQAAAEAAQVAAELAETNAETAETNAETAETNAETAETNAETAQAAAEVAQAAAEAVLVDPDFVAVVAIEADITTVAGIAADVTTVAGISADVTSVAAIDSDVSTVASDIADVTTVASNIGSVNTVSGISSNVTTVAGISSNVTTVAGISSNVTTVAGISGNVTTVAGISSNVTTVAGISADVTTVAGDSADIQLLADNIATIAAKANAGANSDITSLSGLTTPLSVGQGGTGANTLTGYVKGAGTTALTASSTIPNTDITGLGTMSTQAASNVAITGGSINGTTVGASTAASGAFTSLTSSSTTTLNGTTIPASKTLLVSTDIGSTVQAYDAQLADVAGLTPTDNNFIVGNGTNFVTESGSTARTSLGLGSIATQDSSNVTVTGGSINGTTVGASTATTGKFTTLEATGVTTVQAGTVSLPAITTTGDTNTGIFFPAADTIAFTEGGVEAMRIDSSGNVGIGTSSPSADYFTQARLLQITGSLSAAIKFERTTTTARKWEIGLTSGGNFDFTDTVASTSEPRLRIDTSGNVGIGTTSPVSSAGYTALTLNNATNSGYVILQSNGVTKSDWYSSGGSDATLRGVGVPLHLVATGANYIYATTNGSERMRIDSSGNVGIGTSSPGAKLDVSEANAGGTVSLRLLNTSTSASSNSQQFNYVNGATAGDPYTTWTVGGVSAWSAGLRNSDSDKWYLSPGGSLSTTPSLVVDTGGNVGIGTTSIGARLDIAGTAGTLRITSTTGTNGVNLRVNNTGGDFYFGRENSTSGAFGVTAYSSVLWSEGAYPMVFATNNTERMRITSGGDLVVGTTSVQPADDNINGFAVRVNAPTSISNMNGQPLIINRGTTDGVLINLYQDAASEGNISVSGTTVSYNGGHLSRWSQLPDGSKDDTILKGTVLTNLDDMCVWTKDGTVLDNEQLNKMKVSDVEGDTNVAGVFVNWTRDEQCNTDDMNVAMTGDMIIRIAEGVVVQKGDLLMSAGDGTAKPQGDDIVRSKTIAKVTSNHVTCTYADGSYCVPCVLMAC
jgi:hypothetical protein